MYATTLRADGDEDLTYLSFSWKCLPQVSFGLCLQTEKRILRKLADADQLGRRHCIKLQRSFEYRGHLCLVFDAMVSTCRGSCLMFGQRQAPCMQPVQAGCQV